MTDEDPRIVLIADTLARLVNDEIVPQIDPTAQGDGLDAIIVQLNRIAEVIAQHRAEAVENIRRFEDFVDVIGGMAALDFTRKAYVGEAGSLIDAMAVGINMLSEELAASTVSRSDMDRIIESMLDALVVADQHGKIEMVNRAASRLFGRSREELIAQQVATLFVEARDVETIVARVTQEGVLRRLESICHGASGPISVSISASALEGTYVGMRGIVYIVRDITDRKQAEVALRQNIIQEETIRVQAAALVELSTPLIPISDRVVVMPLVGALDSRRAQQVLETLLEGIASTSADVAILDITGVPVVDTQVANGLIHAAQAVRLLGAEVMLTGIRPEVAQTLVGLGVDLQGIVTHNSLQNGIAAVLRRRQEAGGRKQARSDLGELGRAATGGRRQEVGDRRS